MIVLLQVKPSLHLLKLSGDRKAAHPALTSSSGLDPYLGILHADRHGDHPTLVFDFIEPYRAWADRVALQLAESGIFDEESFEPDADERGLWLSRTGKSAVIEAMLAFMETSSEHRGRQIKHLTSCRLGFTS